MQCLEFDISAFHGIHGERRVLATDPLRISGPYHIASCLKILLHRRHSQWRIGPGEATHLAGPGKNRNPARGKQE